MIIAIAPCGGALCGTVEWASAKAQADARKGTANLVGTALITDLRPNGPGKWRGRLFVPDRNIRVKAKLTLTNDGSLKVSGCAAGGLLCDSQLWARRDAAP